MFAYQRMKDNSQNIIQDITSSRFFGVAEVTGRENVLIYIKRTKITMKLKMCKRLK